MLSAAATTTAAGGGVEAGQAADPHGGLGHPVGEERVRAGRVGLAEAPVDQRDHRQPGDLVDAGLVQQAQREQQVGVGVGVDPVARQGGRQA